MGKRPPISQLSVLSGSILLAISTGAGAAGFGIIENSASGMGNAFAGGAAVAEDASTIYFNPAGMTNLKGTQMVAAGHIIAPSAEFSNQGSYVNPALTGGTPIAGTLPGVGNDDGGETAFVPNFYLSSELGNGLWAGIGVNAPFGMSTEYNDNWVGRYHALESTVKTININPSIAWQVNDMVSLGAGFSAQYIDATLSNAVDFGTVCYGAIEPMFPGSCAAAGVAPLAADGKAEVKGSDWSMGYNLGAMFNLSKDTRIGLSYRSKIEQKLRGTVDFTVPANFQAILDMGLPLFSDTGATAAIDLPESASASIFSQVTPQLALMADVTYTKWSRFEELRIQYDNPMQPDTVQPENWDNSMRYSVGASYRTNNQMILRAGFAYDQTVIDQTTDRTPRIPDNDRKWLALGMGYSFTDKLGMDVGYAHLFVDDSAMNALDHSTGHQLVGEYNSDVDIFSAQLNYKF